MNSQGNMNYYLLCGKHTPLGTVAFDPGEFIGSNELILDLEGKTEMPFEFSLMKVEEGPKGLVYSNDLNGLEELFLDYQANSLAWPMMSKKLRDVVIQNLTGKEGVDWLSCTINADEKQRQYYIPRFARKLDVLDMAKTMFVHGTDLIIRPWFSIEKIKSYNFFTKPSSYDLWKITPAIYVSESMKRAIQNAALTGISFEKTLAS